MATEFQQWDFYDIQENPDYFAEEVQIVDTGEADNILNAFRLPSEPPGWLNNAATSRAQDAMLKEAERNRSEPKFVPFKNLRFPSRPGDLPVRISLQEAINKQRKKIRKLGKATQQPKYQDFELLGDYKKPGADSDNEDNAKPAKKLDALHDRRLKRKLLDVRQYIHEGIEKARSNYATSDLAPKKPVAGLETDGSDGREPFQLMPHQRDAAGRLRHLIDTKGGALLADDMGLGKTLTLIATLMMRLEEARRSQESIHFLLVVPPSLVHVWVKELGKAPSVKYRVFNDKTLQETTKANLLKYDVVMVANTVLEATQRRVNDCMTHFQAQQEGFEDVLMETLNILAEAQRSRRKSRKPTAKDRPFLITERIESALMAVEWEWVIVDEAHSMKKHTNSLAIMARTLKAKGRVALTGTPIHNTLKDLFSLLVFLDLAPFNDLALFRACFVQKDGKMKGRSAAARYNHYRNDMNEAMLSGYRSSFTVKRDKGRDFDGDPILGVLEPRCEQYYVELTDDYAWIQDEIDYIWDPQARKRRAEAKAQGEDDPAFASGHDWDILKKIAHAKLAIIHPELLNARYGEYGLKDDFINALAGTSLAEVLQDRRDEIGEAAASEGAVEKHVKKGQVGKLKKKEQQEWESRRGKFISQIKSTPDAWQSDRMYAVVDVIGKLLTARRAKANQAATDEERKVYLATSKILVFCEYLSALDVLEIGIAETHGFNALRFDGTRTHDQRLQARHRFEEVGKDFSQPGVEPDDIPIMLITNRAGSEGISLVHAAEVVIVGPTWNPYVEMQCISRPARKGREGDVTVHRFVCPTSIELRICDLQSKKRGKVERALNDEYLLGFADDIEVLSEKDYLNYIGYWRARRAARKGQIAGLDQTQEDDDSADDVDMGEVDEEDADKADDEEEEEGGEEEEEEEEEE